MIGKDEIEVKRVADYDILIIGGGVNGTGIARDAAGRGYSVLLCEQGDLGQATSSASSKLIHGGLRYLEHYEFRLVRAALREREVLLHSAPHIVRPLRFILPHDQTLRPAWLIRAGLFLYDHMGARNVLPGSKRLDLRRHPAGEPLNGGVSTGFAYSDCSVDDSRLVILNALDASERGADVRPLTAFATAQSEAGEWKAALLPDRGNRQEFVTARVIVNAAGPWVGAALDGVVRKKVRLVKGSHIVVPKLYEGGHAYILQNDDRRIIFVIPYEGDYSLIGTTDAEFEGDPASAKCSAAETEYLCAAVNRWFDPGIRPEQVVWDYAGVRPLLDDEAENAASASRDYRLDLDQREGEGAMLTVVGGKVTTFRKLAEQAVDRLRPILGGGGPAWTENGVLPGGNLPHGDFEGFAAETRHAYPWLPASLVNRLCSAYGTRVSKILDGKKGIADLGQDLGCGLYEAELAYLKEHEWARASEDVLWRRTKLGLRADSEMRGRLDDRLR